MGDNTHPTYSLELRSFAPFEKFGHGYDGDKRGFSLASNSSSRIHAVTQIDPHNASASTLQVHSDVTKGPRFFVGAQGEGRSNSVGNVTSSAVPLGAQYQIHASGSNPLIKGAPDIDIHADVTVTQPTPGAIKISATLTGDKFPASELVIRDPSGQGLFLGGYMPASAGATDFAMLVGDSQRTITKLEIVATVDSSGNWGKVLSAHLDGPHGTLSPQLDSSTTLTSNGWNRTVMQALTPDKMPAPDLQKVDQKLEQARGHEQQRELPKDVQRQNATPPGGLER